MASLNEGRPPLSDAILAHSRRSKIYALQGAIKTDDVPMKLPDLARALTPSLKLKRLLGLTFAFLSLAAPSGYAADSFAWVAKASCPLQRFEAVGGAAAGKLYQFSGYYTVGSSILATPRCDAYDPAANIWTRIADIPQAISHSGQVADTDSVNNLTFWLAGGFLGNHPGPSTTQTWKYSITNNSWSAGPALPAARAGGALVKLGRELHYFGGVIRINGIYQQDYGTHWSFDLDNGTSWRTTTSSGEILAPMPNPRNHMGGVALNGKLYAIGGQHLGDEKTGAQSEVDVYDAATNSWTQAAPMPRPIGHLTANVFVRNGRIVITSGVTSNSVEIANVIEYDPLTNSWSELPPLPGPRQSPVSGLVGTQIVVTCGLHNGVQAETWITQASASSQAVVSFTLINADTDQPISGYEVINNGAVINSASLPTTHLNIRANTSPAIVGSVRFGFDGNANARTESQAPYALFGNSGTDYAAGTLSVGSHVLSGTPYTATAAGGTTGTPLTISFTIQ